jgi:hypothetical protein
MFTALSLTFSNRSKKERVLFEICLYAPFLSLILNDDGEINHSRSPVKKLHDLLDSSEINLSIMTYIRKFIIIIRTTGS